jgi:hypothetical protein
MDESYRHFAKLTRLTDTEYQFANSMQTGHRKIPFAGAINSVGTNYHWTHVLPLYKQELDEFRARLIELKSGGSGARPAESREAWPAARVSVLSTNAETYEIRPGARPFRDRTYTIIELAPELNGLTGIRFSHELAKNGRYAPVEFEVNEPVYVLVGYFNENRDIWLQVPNLDVASHADERGGVDPVIRNGAAIQECPGLNVHAFRYEAGRHKLEMIGTGSFVVFGVVPQTVNLEKRDARIAGAR